MIYGTVCSGIEAPTVAWKPLGWEAAFFSEIERFPRAVLAHHYPAVPLHGDFTELTKKHVRSVDLLIAGTPCQSFSVAGAREGLDDPRGNLTLEFLRLAGRLRPRWLVWENVPGVLSNNEGRDFGTILGALGKLGYGWAYRILDAQYFGVAQRRRRVFLVANIGSAALAAAVLFERHCLSGDSAPRGEAGQEIAGTIGGGSENRGWCNDLDRAGAYIPMKAHTLKAHHLPGSRLDHQGETYLAFGGNSTSGPIEIATAVNAKGGAGRGDFESETFIAHSLRGEGFDASEDGTGRGTPLVPVAVHARQDPITSENIALPIEGAGVSTQAIAFDTTQITSPGNFSAPREGEPCHPLAEGGHPPAIAFEARYARNGRGAPGKIVPPLKVQSGTTGKGDAAPLVASLTCGDRGISPDQAAGSMIVPAASAVRRLTPRECERLQGFPDDYTRIPWGSRKKIEAAELLYIRLTNPELTIDEARQLAADGPRYKALGNSMAVPVVRWIGQRIEMVERILLGASA